MHIMSKIKIHIHTKGQSTGNAEKCNNKSTINCIVNLIVIVRGIL